jgi:hypothetical protein
MLGNFISVFQDLIPEDIAIQKRRMNMDHIRKFLGALDVPVVLVRIR